MKTRTKVKAGTIILNHNQTRARIKETPVRDSSGLKVKTRLKAGHKTP